MDLSIFVIRMGTEGVMNLSLNFVDNGTQHNDIVLEWEGKNWVCDSYYLALDDYLLPEVEDVAKIRAVLWRLLEQWLETLNELLVDEIAFLPYDFSDQYTGWLRCTRRREGFLVERGWSNVEGWSFAPSRIGSLLRSLDEFRADGSSVELPTEGLLESIRKSMAHAAS
ncbi:hypothetical protein [Variovorax sp. YR634]|uniref:hypothetical protein n=1 Tax=Variovorax sp. YR634 TaxID=1884385 RepID=UPI000B8A1F1D|nr:hypothetical protein [Variovorax sp. YR634]